MAAPYLLIPQPLPGTKELIFLSGSSNAFAYGSVKFASLSKKSTFGEGIITHFYKNKKRAS
jgi:hypothetical protein